VRADGKPADATPPSAHSPFTKPLAGRVGGLGRQPRASRGWSVFLSLKYAAGWDSPPDLTRTRKRRQATQNTAKPNPSPPTSLMA